MSRYLEIMFRSKLRLLVLVVLVPLAVSALDLYLWRSYDAVEVVWVDDPSTLGPNAAGALGFDPYATISQNAARLFSNLLGTQTFNDAVGTELLAKGVISSERDRAALIPTLSQLTVAPGGVASAGASGGGGGGGAMNGDHTVTFRYVCKVQELCNGVLAAVLDVLRAQYGDLKARAAATSRSIYEANLKAAEADVGAATAAIQHYVAGLPPTTSRTQQQVDPVLAGLQHELDQAQKEVDKETTQIQNIDTLVQMANGFATDLFVVDGPKTLPGLYGIKGLRNDNLKTVYIALAACLVAGGAYVMLVAFLDRTVRDPDQIKNRLGKAVITIPTYQSGRLQKRRFWLRTRANQAT